MTLKKFENLDLRNEVVQSLTSAKEELRQNYLKNKEKLGIGYTCLDNLLPDALAQEIYKNFPKDIQSWREISSFRENKLTSKEFDSFPILLGQITFALQSAPVLSLMEEITGIKNLEGDPTLYAGGLSAMRIGDFLNPHIDNSHNQSRTVYRRINALFYVSPEWKEEFGGNLELWDNEVKERVTIHSKFNRLVLMETNDKSWHSVSKVKKEDRFRCCVSNYYFSKESPLGYDYYHVTSFAGRPEEPIKRILSSFDNKLRSLVRVVKKDGLGKKDHYQLKK